MKSDILRISSITVIAIGVVGLIGGLGWKGCADVDRQVAAEIEQCKQMCTSGIISCKETTDYKSLVVDCSIDGGHELRVTEVVKIK